jgi:hypothetical protein
LQQELGVKNLFVPKNPFIARQNKPLAAFCYKSMSQLYNMTNRRKKIYRCLTAFPFWFANKKRKGQQKRVTDFNMMKNLYSM